MNGPAFEFSSCYPLVDAVWRESFADNKTHSSSGDRTSSLFPSTIVRVMNSLSDYTGMQAKHALTFKMNQAFFLRNSGLKFKEILLSRSVDRSVGN